MLELISLEESNHILSRYGQTLGVEHVLLRDSLRRVLAEDLTAQTNIPPFDRSAVDGYGISSKDTGLNQFKIIGETPAGYTYEDLITPGNGLRIFTGAPVAKGIVAVIRQEDVCVQGEQIVVKKQWKPGDNIALCGEDVTEGEPLLSKGTVITPAYIGLLAAQGISKVPVFRQPKVGVLSTGDELVALGEPLTPGKIFNSNLPSLIALVEDLGGEALDLGIVSDSLETTSLAIENALKKVNLLVTTGGVSVGDYDRLKEAILHMGGEILFWKVSIRPGTPMVIGLYKDQLIIGLSGNPAAAMIGAELFLAPLIRMILGHREANLKRCNAIVHGDIRKPASTRRMIRVQIVETSEGIIAKISPKQKSGVLKSLAEANGVIDLAPGAVLNDGDGCQVILFNRWKQ